MKTWSQNIYMRLDIFLYSHRKRFVSHVQLKAILHGYAVHTVCVGEIPVQHGNSGGLEKSLWLEYMTLSLRRLASAPALTQTDMSVLLAVVKAFSGLPVVKYQERKKNTL